MERCFLFLEKLGTICVSQCLFQQGRQTVNCKLRLSKRRFPVQTVFRRCGSVLKFIFTNSNHWVGILGSNGVASCGFSAGHTSETYDTCKSNVARPGMDSGLFWCRNTFSAVFVWSQASGSSSAAGERPLPKPARMATVEMLVCFEELVFLHLRKSYNVGLVWQVALGHGILRWSDLQQSKDLTLTDDALKCITWRMKKRSVQVPWAVFGLVYLVATGRLSGKFCRIMAYLVRDSVILAPSHDLKSFKDLFANFYRCQSMLRTLLLHSGSQHQRR